ncbi:MAG: LCP family protein [Oscillospiraceae bacterium]|nr:LCP family protein [Oscillospiraceae bacterium]
MEEKLYNRQEEELDLLSSVNDWIAHNTWTPPAKRELKDPQGPPPRATPAPPEPLFQAAPPADAGASRGGRGPFVQQPQFSTVPITPDEIIFSDSQGEKAARNGWNLDAEKAAEDLDALVSSFWETEELRRAANAKQGTARSATGRISPGRSSTRGFPPVGQGDAPPTVSAGKAAEGGRADGAPSAGPVRPASARRTPQGTMQGGERSPLPENPYQTKRSQGNTARSGKKPPGKPAKKKKHVVRRVILLLAALLLAGGGSLYALAYSMAGKVNYIPTQGRSNPYISDAALKSSPLITNILLIGVDTWEDTSAARSDTMLLLSIDRMHRQLKITSFLRDSWVVIPDSGYAKLNAACSSGGAQLVKDTLEYNFHVRIDHFVQVSFAGFQAVIDALDGVDVAVTAEEAAFLLKTTRLGKQIGMDSMIQQMNSVGAVHLTGEQALVFCRIRYLDDDFHRTQRQRQVFQSMLNRFNKNNPIQMKAIAEKILANVETDLDQATLTNLVLGGLIYRTYPVAQFRVPADGTWSNANKNGAAVLEMDMDANISQLKAFIYEK